MGIEVREVRTAAEREAVMALRHQVFVREQGVPEALEADAHDREARHLLALLNGEVVGAARHRDTADGIKLERVAVLSAHRRAGVGAALVEHLLSGPGRDADVYCHAQLEALSFWTGLGFIARGEVFQEAGIAHRLMLRSSSRSG